MREVQIYDVIDEILKTQDTCSLQDMIAFKSAYEKEHPNAYVCITRDDIYDAKYAYGIMFYWDDKRNVFIRQDSVECPVCNSEHLKYPNIEKFEKIQKAKTEFTVEDMREAFNAGLNRGVYVVSVIKPIDGDYPTYEEYIEEKLKPKNK